MSDAKTYGLKKYWVLLANYRGRDGAEDPEFVGIVPETINVFYYQKIKYDNDTVCQHHILIMQILRRQAQGCHSSKQKRQLPISNKALSLKRTLKSNGYHKITSTISITFQRSL